MNQDQSYPVPQVFLVDGGGGGGGPHYPAHQPSFVPCWSYLPPQESHRGSHQKRSWSCMGVRPCAAVLVLMLFLLVFAALGFGAFQIDRMQRELRELKQVRAHLHEKSKVSWTVMKSHFLIVWCNLWALQSCVCLIFRALQAAQLCE